MVYFSDFLKSAEALRPRDADLRTRPRPLPPQGPDRHGGRTALLKRVGIDAKAIDSGCCGMAGSFGFRPETYDLSVKAAELKLLPAVRAAGDDEVIIASGYSCREQIDQLSPRKAVHVAEAVARALQLPRA